MNQLEGATKKKGIKTDSLHNLKTIKAAKQKGDSLM